MANQNIGEKIERTIRNVFPATSNNMNRASVNLFVLNKLKPLGFKRIAGLSREWINRLTYKDLAPLYAECIWVDPGKCKKSIRIGSQTATSGKVVKKKKTFAQFIPLREEPTIKKCLMHWIDGVSWQDTGIYDELMSKISQYGSFDGCKNKHDVRIRYNRLDELFYQVKEEQRLKPQQELSGKAFREEGGILIHLGPGAEPYFGGNGNHRMAIVMAAGLDIMPAQLGAIYHDALGYLPGLRQAK